MRKAIIAIFLFLLLIPLSSATFTDEWAEYQDDPTNRGFVHDEVGQFTGFSQITQINTGTDFQPFVLDWDDDDSQEIIIIDNTDINVLSSSFVQEATYNLGTKPVSQPTMYNNGSEDVLVLLEGGELQFFTYASTTITQANKSSVTVDAVNETTGLRYSNGFIHFAVIGDDATNTTTYHRYNSSSFTSVNSSSLAVRGVKASSPAVSDIDNDGVDEFVFTCDDDENGQFGLCVVDTAQAILDTGFSSDGKIDNISTIGGVDYISSPVLYNVNGFGTTEIIISYSYSCTCSGQTNEYCVAVRAYNADGTILWTRTDTDTLDPLMDCDPNNFQSRVSLPYIAFDGAVTEICIYKDGTDVACGSSEKKMGCLNATSGAIVWNYTTPANLCANDVIDIDKTAGFAFSDLSDTGDDYHVFGPYVFTDDTYQTNFTSSVDSSYNSMTSDIDNDGLLDIFYSKQGTSFFVKTNTTNSVPTLNNSKAHGGYYGYFPIACVNTTMTFQAAECASFDDCNYENDNAQDRERLVTNCGTDGAGAQLDFNSSTSNGTYSSNNPTFSCFYNVTGSYNVRLYLEDEANPADQTQYNTLAIPISIINGIPGQTCNVPSDQIGAPSEQRTLGTASDDAGIETTLSILAGGSEKARLLMGLVIVLTIAMGIWFQTQNAIFAGLGAVMGLIFCTFFGLLSPWILIIFIIAMVFWIWIIRLFTGSNTDMGGG